MKQNSNNYKKNFQDCLLDKMSFVNALLKKMRKEYQYFFPVYDETTRIIEWGGVDFFIENIYEDYSRYSGKKAETCLNQIFERLKSTLQIKEKNNTPFEDVIPLLLPIVRSRSYFENLQQFGKIPYKLLNEHLALGISIDTEASIALLKEATFEQWKKDFDVVYNYALQNLEAINNDDAIEELSPGVWRSTWKDGTDPSRILYAATQWRLKIKGNPVFFIPHREVFIMTGSNDTKGIEYAIDFCEDYHDLNRSIVSIPFTVQKREDGNYSLDTFTIYEDHPLYQKITHLIKQFYQREYALQESQFEKISEGEITFVLYQGFIVHLSDFQLTDSEDLTLVSTARGITGIPILLPEVEWVYVNYECTRFISFGDLISTFNSHIHLTDLYPQRYFIYSFPSISEIEEMGIEIYSVSSLN
jgi:uncharacterized protein YtpQ (UPF0354 family)